MSEKIKSKKIGKALILVMLIGIAPILICNLASAANVTLFNNSLSTISLTYPQEFQTNTFFVRVPNGTVTEARMRIQGFNMQGLKGLPRDIILVTDLSASMAGSKITSAKAADFSFVNNTDTNYIQIGLVSYSTTATLDRQLTTNKVLLNSTITNYGAGGYTNIGRALVLAMAELSSTRAQRPNTRKYILLMTDGWANVLQNGAYQDSASYNTQAENWILNTLAPQAAANGITIFTVSFGPCGEVYTTGGGASNAHCSFMEDVAAATDGIHYNAPTGQDLIDIYNDIAAMIETTDFTTPTMNTMSPLNSFAWRYPDLYNGNAIWNSANCGIASATCSNFRNLIQSSLTQCAAPLCDVRFSAYSTTVGMLTLSDLYIEINEPPVSNYPPTGTCLDRTMTCPDTELLRPTDDGLMVTDPNDELNTLTWVLDSVRNSNPNGNYNFRDTYNTDRYLNFSLDPAYANNPFWRTYYFNISDPWGAKTQACINVTYTGCIAQPPVLGMSDRTTTFDYSAFPLYQYDLKSMIDVMQNVPCGLDELGYSLEPSSNFTITGPNADGIIGIIPNDPGWFRATDDKIEVQIFCPVIGTLVAQDSANLTIVYLAGGVLCGNGVVDPGSGEECDLGPNNNNAGTCSEVCRITECNDTIIQQPNGRGTFGPLNNGVESCDDGNLLIEDGCTPQCVLEWCGDHDLQPGLGEQCDDGDSNDNGDGCVNCQLQVPPACGNVIIEVGEDCDDGNLINGDGCDSTCHIEVPIGCGNGIIEDGEGCDDMNNNPNDGCDQCHLIYPPYCPNGVLEENEECDDGNSNNGDGCNAICRLEVPPGCGNGIVEQGEQCDDGNNDDGDGCNATCWIEPGPTIGLLNTSVSFDYSSYPGHQYSLANMISPYATLPAGIDNIQFQVVHVNSINFTIETPIGFPSVNRTIVPVPNWFSPRWEIVRVTASYGAYSDTAYLNITYTGGALPAVDLNDMTITFGYETYPGGYNYSLRNMLNPSALLPGNVDDIQFAVNPLILVNFSLIGPNSLANITVAPRNWYRPTSEIVRVTATYPGYTDTAFLTIVYTAVGAPEGRITCGPAPLRIMLHPGEDYPVSLARIFEFQGDPGTVNSVTVGNVPPNLEIDDSGLPSSVSFRATGTVSGPIRISATTEQLTSEECTITFLNMNMNCDRPLCAGCGQNFACLRDAGCLERSIWVIDPFTTFRPMTDLPYSGFNYQVTGFATWDGFGVSPTTGFQSTTFLISDTTGIIPHGTTSAAIISMDFDGYENSESRMCIGLTRYRYNFNETGYDPDTPLLITGSRAVMGFYEMGGYVFSKGPYIFIAKVWQRE